MTSTNEPDIRVAGLRKRYQDAVAVDDVSFSVEPGALWALLGPSGCGKTTTLRMIAGLVLPDQGDIFIRGAPVTDTPVHKRNVGMLFQNYALFPHMNVASNIAFGLEMRSSDRGQNRAKVDDVLRLMQLSGYADRYPHELSGGQQQRVALARALVIEPAVLLLDEPLGALDKKLREEMQIELKDLQRRLKITTIMVTHDQEEALTLSDVVVVMRDGRIEQIGPPSEIYEKPDTRFVADFIGVSNFFEGEVVSRQGDDVLVRTGTGVQLLASANLGSSPHATLSIRPEAVRLSALNGKADLESPPNAAKGIVERVVYRGLIRQYYVRLDGGEHLISFRQNADRGEQLAPGAAVLAAWDGSNVRFLRN